MEEHLSRSFASIFLRYNGQNQVGGYLQNNKYCCFPGDHREERGSCSLDLEEEMGEKERTA